MGYRIAPPLFLSAGDVGAPHERERVFILAYRDGAGQRISRIARGEHADDQRCAEGFPVDSTGDGSCSITEKLRRDSDRNSTPQTNRGIRNCA